MSLDSDDDQCTCPECEGQGSYDQWKAVNGHFAGGEVFSVKCELCGGDGKLDRYGNPFSGDRIINCCFPDCGCDGARLCMAETGASRAAMSVNIERGSWNGRTPLHGDKP
jgi:DnaJ-class molecular chaperone